MNIKLCSVGIPSGTELAAGTLCSVLLSFRVTPRGIHHLKASTAEDVKPDFYANIILPILSKPKGVITMLNF